MNKMSKRSYIPPLEGWITVAEVADLMDVSRQTAHTLVTSGKFDTLRRVGRSTLVVSEEEARSVKKSQG